MPSVLTSDGLGNDLRRSSAEFLSIQYLRACAALMIVVFHSLHNVVFRETGRVTEYLTPLQAGVDLFFVISGFIMWSTTRTANRTPAQFLASRLIRIAPLYWAVTLLVVAITLMQPSAVRSTHFDVPHILASLLFIPWSRPSEPYEILPTFVLGWTLNYEMLFYLVFAASLLMKTKAAIWYLLLTLLAIFLLGTIIPLATIHGFYGNSLLLEFLLGVVLAVSVEKGFRLPLRASLVLILFGVLGLVLSVYSTMPRSLHWGLPAFAIVAGAVLYEKSARMPDFALLKRLGDASYSMYLLHGIFIAIAIKLLIVFHPGPLGGVSGAAATLILIAISCIAALISYRCFEQPISRFLKQRSDHWFASRRMRTPPEYEPGLVSKAALVSSVAHHGDQPAVHTSYLIDRARQIGS